ncbi:MAG: DUF4399 domain-containing protein [Gammaproteobacteria bacterium]|jgi:hypothetical protein|nr:DUF4399 domain-containing protein [Gammaproteobacteria bacterium]
MSRLSLILVFVVVSALPIQVAMAHKAKKNAEVFIENLEDGAVVQGPVHVRFGARYIEIAPIGVNVHRSGHHHLLVNVPEPKSMDDLIPFDDNHLHYMNGEKEAVIDLPPGEHTLQLILGDEEHQPWGENLVSKRITIRVEEEAWGSRHQTRD